MSELNKREQAIAMEGFMVGRVYATGGEKEKPSEIYDKVFETCARTASQHPDTPQRTYADAVTAAGEANDRIVELEKVVEAARKIEEMPCEAQIIDELWDAIKALDELDGRSG